MSEWMGLIQGCYDAKEEGFLPGGVSLHTTMTAHGPDKKAFEKATQAKLVPTYYDQILAFMFESYCPWLPTTFAEQSPLIDKDYLACWQGF
jgi:homogentisate 1,2-dioxygenase